MHPRSNMYFPCYIDLIRVGVHIQVHRIDRDLEYKVRYLES
jgi:hypothetical protein